MCSKLGNFIADYVDVMPTLTGRSSTQIETAARLLSSELRTVTNCISVLKFFDRELEVYARDAKNYEQHKDTVVNLQKFIRTHIKAWEQDMGTDFK